MRSTTTKITALVTLLALASCDSGRMAKKDEAASEARMAAPAEAPGDAMKLDDAVMEEAEADEAEPMMREEMARAKKKDGKGKPDDGKKTWKRSKKVANTSKLSVGDDQDLPIRGMSVTTRVDGWRARVLIDFYFLNDTDRTLEGTFKLRLPDGATPYFLAFGQSNFTDDAQLQEAIRKAVSYTHLTLPTICSV